MGKKKKPKPEQTQLCSLHHSFSFCSGIHPLPTLSGQSQGMELGWLSWVPKRGQWGYPALPGPTSTSPSTHLGQQNCETEGEHWGGMVKGQGDGGTRAQRSSCFFQPQDITPLTTKVRKLKREEVFSPLYKQSASFPCQQLARGGCRSHLLAPCRQRKGFYPAA